MSDHESTAGVGTNAAPRDAEPFAVPAPLDQVPDPAQRQDLPLPDSDPGPRRSPKRRGRWVVAGIAIGAAVAMAVTGVVVLVTRDGGPDHPSTWDPTVAELVPFVEHEKGASFEHPVSVVVLDEAQFKERLSVDDELTEEDREEIEQAEAALRALGLNGGKGSLVEQVDTLMTEGTAAYYDPDQDEIVVPETSAGNVAAQATLVHELTHALQDQLGQLDDADTSDAQAGLEALIEGEAEHVQTAWIEELTDAERDRLAEDEGDTADEVSGELEDVNPALIALFTLPYTVGETMVSMLDDANRLDDAFDDPPGSTADLLDPLRWLDPVEAVEVEAPTLGEGEEQQGDDAVLGAHFLYLMLASVLEPSDALDAVSGWGGDQMRFYRTADGADCLRASIVGVTAEDTSRIGDALESWVESRPDGAASTSESGGLAHLDACDPGTTPETLTEEMAHVPAFRAELVSLFVESGANLEAATCAATDVLGRLPMDVLMAAESSSNDEDRIREAVEAAVRSCTG